MTNGSPFIVRVLSLQAPQGSPLLDFIHGDASSSALSGMMGPARSLVAACRIAGKPEVPALVVVPDEKVMQSTISDLSTFLKLLGVEREVLPYPAFAVNLYRGLSPHPDVAAARARVLSALAARQPIVAVAAGRAIGYRLARPDLMASANLELCPGERFEARWLEHRLVGLGFRYEDPVTGAGEFARRGGIVDVFPPGETAPYRLEFLDDQLEEIRCFDVKSQRTIAHIESLRLGPVHEWPVPQELAFELESRLDTQFSQTDRLDGRPESELRAQLPMLEEYQATLADYLPADSPPLLFTVEPVEVNRALTQEWERMVDSFSEAATGPQLPPPDRILVQSEEWSDRLRRQGVGLYELEPTDRDSLHVRAQLVPSFRHRVKDFFSEIRKRIDSGFVTLVFVPNEATLNRLVELLSDAGVGVLRADGDTLSPDRMQGVATLCIGELSQGFDLSDERVSFLTATELVGSDKSASRRASTVGRFLSDFRDLKPGDYVVHSEQGVGVFAGLTKLDLAADGQEFVLVEYLGADKLYVPVEKLDLLEKFRSAEGATPRIDKLGGASWGKVQKRVRKSMQDMAAELLRLYAARQTTPGHAFSPRTPWQEEFDGMFPFEETPDQMAAIQDIERDMEASAPMDRLICGDVGYGKTEVAMRAAFKAVMETKQVAVLVPTTILAFQHFNTFVERFGTFPVRIEMLSRFKTAKEQKIIVRDLADGKVDIVIGTHRLLSKDVQFKDLGCLVVDEEQRFGVRHKEKLKSMSHGVDCLTLSATPIPRTLHMSFSGIRDMSLIETPPKDRMSIQTQIVGFNESVITEAIRFELNRGGQVYFVHNRIGSIYSLASYLARLVPEARIAVGHGQMKESELERVMLRLVRHEIDVFVSTAIIENGLDVPLVNTLIVNRADRFGLSQLYQLRGRVGRSDRRAYAYLIVPDQANLTQVARRRLAAIREFTELGAGFRIAALDLELRGAGNILGRHQHGHIEAVGFDMYCRLLEEAVHQLSGDSAPVARVQLNLGLKLKIPESYMLDTNDRMSLYKRVSSAHEFRALELLEGETRDRYGALPGEVVELFQYARLRLNAEALGLTSIDRKSDRLQFVLSDASPLDPAGLGSLVGRWPGTELLPSGTVVIPFAPTGSANVLAMTGEVLRELQSYSNIAV